MQRVTLDPLSAVQEPTQRCDPGVDDEPEGLLYGADCAHLIGHWTDSTDARGDIRRLGTMAASEERLEESWRFEDLQLRFGDTIPLND